MDHLRLKGLVTEAITNLCKTGLNYKSEFCVEGLLGITLDNEGVFLINIKETFSTSRLNGMCLTTDQRDFCDLGAQAALACGVTDGNYLNAAVPASISTALDVTKNGLLCDRSDKQDAFQLNAIDLNISNNKLSDLEILFDLSTTPGRKKDLLPMDMTTSFLDQEQDLPDDQEDQLCDKVDGGAKQEDDEMSDSSELAIIKEEQQLMQAVEQSAQGQSSLGKNDLSLMSLDTINTQTGDTMFLNFRPGDYQLPACSAWESADYFDAVPLNLSEPQDNVQPQDLSIHQTKQQKTRYLCELCSKKFRSESGLNKHMEKEHTDADAADKPGALALVKEPLSQPLDLTTGRSENEGDGDDFEHDLQLRNQEPFNCVCGKVINDYESYIEHVTACSKSKLTPCKSCEICGKYFFSNSGYVKHKRLHLGSYKFHCEVCHKGFFDRTHLRAHMDSSHRKVRRYECDICNKSFFWKHHLKRHKVTCEKAKGFTYKQKTCAV